MLILTSENRASEHTCRRSSSCCGRGSGSLSPERTRKPEAWPPAVTPLTTGVALPGGACSGKVSKSVSKGTWLEVCISQ